MLKQKLNSNDRWILGENGPIVSSASKNIVPTGTKTITENGTGIDVTNYASADVNVQPNVDTKSITVNGTYNASSDNLDGYSSVNVNVQPNVNTKSITANGTYNASSDNLDGYNQVVVSVPSSATGTISITENGTGIDVSSYEFANVSVPGVIPTGTIDILANQGEMTVDVGSYANAHIGNPLLLYNDAYLQSVTADTAEFVVNYNKDKTVSYVSIIPIYVDYTKTRSITSYYFKYCNHNRSTIMKIYTYTADGENPAENMLTGSYIPDPVVDSTNGTITLAGRNNSYKWLSGGGFLIVIGYVFESE